jgi:hypothetical protein
VGITAIIYFATLPEVAVPELWPSSTRKRLTLFGTAGFEALRIIYAHQDA